MNLNSRGSVVSGQGASGVWKDNALVVAPDAGKPAWLTDNLIIHQTSANQLAVIAPGSREIVDPNGASWIVAEGGQWAAFLADGGRTGVRTSWGLHLPAAALLGMKAGVLFVKTSYQAGGISAYAVGETDPGRSLWDRPAQPDIRDDVPQFSALDGDRVLWSEGGTLHTRGLPQPAQISAAFDPFVLEVAGALLVGYHTTDARFVIHPISDAAVGLVVATGDTFGTTGRVVSTDELDLFWATGAAENGNVTSRRVRVADLVERLTTPVTPTSPVAIIGRPGWLGWFEFAGRSPLVPGNCSLPAGPGSDGLIRGNDDQPIARYVNATSDSDVDELDAVIRAARQREPNRLLVPYWTRQAQAIRVPDSQTVGIEAYCGANETDTDFEARLRAACRRVGRAWLIGQCYTSNPKNTTDLRRVVRVLARVYRDERNVDGLLGFSGTGRATGLQDHPEVVDDWRELAAGIPSAPVIVHPPPENPMMPTVDLRDMEIVNTVAAVATWPITTKITHLDWVPGTRGEGIHVDFDKAEVWPDVPIPGWGPVGGLQYTLGCCAKIGGQWVASAVIQFWRGLPRAGAEPSRFSQAWFYADRWGPLAHYQPQPGEWVGFFIAAGNLRDGALDGALRERSNVVFLQFPGSNGGSWDFGGPVVTPPVQPPVIPPEQPPVIPPVQPPVAPWGPTCTYDEIVKHDGQEIADAYKRATGRAPAVADLMHFAWGRITEGKSQAQTLAAIAALPRSLLTELGE